MNVIENILSFQLMQKLGWTLLHFIWQATVVALLLAVLLRILRRFSANLRYVTACLALGLIVFLPVVTMQVINVPPPHKEQPEFRIPNTESIPQAVELQPSAVSHPTSVIYEPVRHEPARANYFAALKQKTADILEPALPHIVTVWLLGVFGLSIWHLGGWTQLQRLRKKMVKQVDSSLKIKLNQLSQKLGITQAVELLESALVQIPTVVGWIKPVILLPAEALTGLTAEQLEAILAHELAHIKRFDYLVNILQTIVEILGFYHPAVWWISHRIRAERENCCDDLAVTVTGDRVRYARALTSMEEIRGRSSELAVAATGGNLFSRIRRVIGKDSSEKTFSWVPAATVILLLVALAIPTTLALTNKSNLEQSDPNSWQKKFYSTYSLEDGQVLKRIAPPFIPERRGFFLSVQPGRYSSNTYEELVSQHFNWDGDLSIRGASVGSGIYIPLLKYTLESVIGLGNREYDIPPDILSTDMSGDWIVRKDTPQEELLQALEQIVKDETGRDIDLVKQKVETDVIIAKGKYNFQLLPNITDGKYVLISTNKTDTYTDGGGGTGKFTKFLQWVGNRVEMNIINETESGDFKLSWRNHDSSSLGNLDHNGQMYNSQLDMLLNNLSLQTGLTFERTKATVEKWFISEDGADKSPQEKSVEQVDPKQKKLNEILEKYSGGTSADKDDENIEGACKSVENYIAFALAGEDEKAAAYAVSSSAVVRQTDDTRQVFKGQPAQITAVCFSEWNALVISSVIQADHGRTGTVIFNLKKEILDQKVHWLIDDIDIETLDSIETEIKRFLDRNPQAKNVLFQPPRLVIAPASSTGDNVNEKVEGEEAWGEAVEGVQVRLRGDKTVWKTDEAGKLRVDIRSDIERVLPIYGPPLDVFEVSIDDIWYKRSSDFFAGLRSDGPSPAKRRDRLYFGFDSKHWKRKSDSVPMYPIMMGKHEIRVAFPFTSTDGEKVLAVSNPIEIEILPGKDFAKQIVDGALRSEPVKNEKPSRQEKVSAAEQVEAEKLKEPGIGRSAVQIEMRIIHASENFPEEIGKKLNIKLDSNTPLDDLQLKSLLKVAQAYKDTKTLVAPKVTVLDNELANFSIVTELHYASGYTKPNSPGEEPKPIIDYKKTGTFCDLKPHVTPDKQNVFLNFELEIIQLTGFEEHIFQGKYKEQIPQIESKTIVTGKSIPDGKTLFLDGGPITIYEKKEETSAETTTDSSEITGEKKRLIILLKPSILSPEQAEQLGLDGTSPPATMGGYGYGYGQGDPPGGFGGMGGSSYGTPPPKILKPQSTNQQQRGNVTEAPPSGKPKTRVYSISELAEMADDVNDLTCQIKVIIEPDSWNKAGEVASNNLDNFGNTNQIEKISDTGIVTSEDTNFVTRNENGEIVSEFGFKVLLHKEGDLWELKKPYRNIYRPDITCYITADEGSIEVETATGTTTMKKTTFNGNVLIHCIPGSSGDIKETKIHCDKLVFLSDRSQLVMSGPTTVISEDIRTGGSGSGNIPQEKPARQELTIEQLEYINNLPSVKAIKEKLAEVEKELITAHQTLSESHPKIQQLLKQKEDLNKHLEEIKATPLENLIKQEYIDKDPAVKALSEQLAKVEQDFSEARQTYTESHPQVRQLLKIKEDLNIRMDEKRQEVGKSYDQGINAQSQQEQRAESENNLNVGMRVWSGSYYIDTLVGTWDKNNSDTEVVEATEQLTKLIMKNVEPDSWFKLNPKAKGITQPNSLERPYSLAITNTGQAHHYIQKLFDILRALSDKGINPINENLNYYQYLYEKQEYETISLRYISPYEAAELINKSLSSQDIEITKKIFIQPLKQSKQLIIFGDERSRQIAKDILLKEIDVPSSDSSNQIMIYTKIIKASDEFLEFVGLDANSLGKSDTWSKYRVTDSNNSARFIIDELNADLLIKAAAAREDCSEMILPRLTATISKPVKIDIPDKQYYAISSPQKTNEATQKPKIEILETGSFIKLTPELTEDRKNIQLDLDIKFDYLIEFQEQKIDGDYKRLVPKTARSQYAFRVVVEDNGILLIRGEKVTQTTSEKSKTPILGDLPLVGGIFRSQYKITDEYTPLILIHPTVLPQQQIEQMHQVKPTPTEKNDPTVK